MQLAAAAPRVKEIVPRIRPGERPTWWRAQADRPAFARWRAAASEADLGLDAWVAILLEFDLALGDLPAGSRPDYFLAAAVAAEQKLSRLGPACGLRAWPHSAGGADLEDELPELVLPERLAARLTPGASIEAHLDPSVIGLAKECERLAALQGRTLESWVLRAALHHG